MKNRYFQKLFYQKDLVLWASKIWTTWITFEHQLSKIWVLPFSASNLKSVFFNVQFKNNENKQAYLLCYSCKLDNLKDQKHHGKIIICNANIFQNYKRQDFQTISYHISCDTTTLQRQYIFNLQPSTKFCFFLFTTYI